MRPKQLTFGESVNGLEGPRLKIRIRMTGHDGPIKAIGMITVASAVTIYPVRIMEGKNGIFAALPQQERKGAWRDVVYPVNRSARDYLQENVVAAFHKNKDKGQSETVIQGYCHPKMQALVVPVTKAGSNLAAMASVVMEDIKIDGISVYRNRDGSLKLYYPQRRWVENGESRIADIVLLTDTYKEELCELVTKEYHRVCKRENSERPIAKLSQFETAKNHTPEMPVHNQFHNFDQRDYSEEEWKQIELWMLKRT